MTRNEAHKHARLSGQSQGFHIFDIDKIIDTIYDNFEQRICNNCKHDYCGCSVQDSILQVDPEATFDTFGCNSFILKDTK